MATRPRLKGEEQPHASGLGGTDASSHFPRDRGGARSANPAVAARAAATCVARRTPSAIGYVGLTSAARAIPYRGRCFTAVTLSHDPELGGGLVIVESANPTIVVDVAEYPGAREPPSAGSGRIAFSYTSLRGSGLYESRIVVRCALEAEAWDECLSVTRDKITTVYGARSPLIAQQAATVAVIADTLSIGRTIEYRRDGSRSQRTNLGTSRLIIPPAR